MGRRLVSCSLAIALAMAALPACGQAETDEREVGGAEASANRALALQRVGNFSAPTYVTAAPGFPRLLFVTEQAGVVRVLNGGKRVRRPFLDIRGIVSSGGERGLLSIAFPPDYRRSGRFYVYYTDRRGDIRVDEFRRSGATRAARGSRRAVIRIPHREHSNHNGGQLQFLGRLLFLATGDGGGAGDPAGNAQNRASLLGKLLRIDPRARRGRPYTVPADNPFVGRPGRAEIYSLGLRNPYRFSFDTTSAARARIAIADVGQDRFEELNYLTVRAARGANFGWNAFEGFAPFRGGSSDPGGTVKPILAYGRARGCTIIGGYVVRDRRLPQLRGRYVYTDLCQGTLRSLAPRLGRARGDRSLGLSVSTPSSFGEDSRGRLYVASLEGPVYRLVPR